MINIELKEVHIGRAIDERREKLQMSKSEFARLIGVPQQHVNRIFEKETIETSKLIKISRVLEFNFFTLYCAFPSVVYAYMAAVAMGDGDAKTCIGDTALASQLELLQQKIEGLEESRTILREQVDQLKSQLEDKNEIIKLYKQK